MGTSICPRCGETIYGTRFCELCGSAATAIAAPTLARVPESASEANLIEQQQRMRAAYSKAPLQPLARPVPYAPAHTNTLAILSLVLGIMGGGLLSVILGHIAKSQIRRTREAGDGLATGGLVLGYFWLVVSVIIVISTISTSVGLYNSYRGY